MLQTARKADLPELGVLAAGLFAVSVLPMVHALTLPGVLYGPNNAVMFGAWAGLPLGLIIAAPTLLKARPITTRLLTHWRGYTTAAVISTAVLCAFLLISPNALPAPSPLNWWTLFGAAFGLAGAMRLSLRQAGLYEVGQRLPSLIAALGFGYIGMSSLVWLVGDPLGLASWLAHGFDGFGVLLAAGGLWLAHRSDTAVADVFAPVLTREPLMALRLGVSPQVTAFLKDLATKDDSTRAHVVRVAELAMVLGEKDGFAGTELRDLGLGAILHDIGKVRVPDAILKKPGALTDGEFEQMKLHTVWGDEMLRCDPEFTEVANLVRGHH
ncbi:MAG: HD-GYP domain-containing protein, partial [Acidimicrobiales bacterium]